MKTDSELKSDVDEELKWNPELNATDIATQVISGAVTLSGFAQNFYEKHVAELTVKRVAGVIAVANDLTVRPRQIDRVSDPELARHAITALKMALPVDWPNITILVHDGHIVLEGTVGWDFLRERTVTAIRRLHGVLDVRDSIRVLPAISATDIKGDIQEAFRRNAIIDSEHVKVVVQGPEVVLRGEVRSWAESDQAYKTAASAPGVVNVVNELTIRA